MRKQKPHKSCREGKDGRDDDYQAGCSTCVMQRDGEGSVWRWIAVYAKVLTVVDLLWRVEERRTTK